MQFLKALACSSIALALAVSVASCGGNKAVVPPPGGNTGLTGQLQQDVNATIGDGGAAITAATVTAINSSTGAVAASGSVDGLGRFSFPTLPAGSYWLRIQFSATADLDASGSMTPVDLLLPVIVTTGGNASTFLFAAVDTDADGTPDAIEVATNVVGSGAAQLSRLQRIEFRKHRILIDLDGDGQLEEAEADTDVDHDALPDLDQGDNSLHGGVLHGAISAISASQVTVRGQVFTITDATRLRLIGNATGAIEQFTVGMNVLVRAIWNGAAWIATEIKQTGQGGGNPPLTAVFAGEIAARTATQLTVGGNTFTVSGSTVWTVNGSATTDLTPFSSGADVLVTASWDGTAWTASHVTLLSGSGGTQTFSGVITAASAASLTAGGQTFVLNAGTQLSVNGTATTDLSLFDVGDAVSIDATLAGNIWTASAVRLTLNNVADTTTLSGAVTAYSSTAVTLGGQTFELSAGTVFKANGAVTTDKTLIDIGDEISVSAAFTGGAWVATEVDLTGNNVIDEATATGLITQKTSVVLTVGGVDYAVSGTTEFMAGGAATTNLELFDVGDEVTIAGSFSGSGYAAATVTLDANNIPDIETATGVISAQTATSLTAGGALYSTGSATIWKNNGVVTADQTVFDVGDDVEVTATFDGTAWTATEVNLTNNRVPDSAGQTTQTFSGELTAMSAAQLSVAGYDVMLDAGTVFIVNGEVVTDLSAFTTGDSISVAAKQELDLSWTAQSVVMVSNQ